MNVCGSAIVWAVVGDERGGVGLTVAKNFVGEQPVAVWQYWGRRQCEPWHRYEVHVRGEPGKVYVQRCN